MNRDKKTKIVVIGGGTGTFVALSGLKEYDCHLTALITVADSGGSTGRLRDEFGFQPVGDLRQALAALAHDSQHSWIRKLLLYRFSKDSSLSGHNLGNLILTALQDMTHSTPEAVEIASQIFRLKGTIYPITLQNIQLVIEYEDGTIEMGEKVLDEKNGGKKITLLKTSPKASIYEKSKKAIENADIIVIGPGDLYGSIMANLVISGVSDALLKSKAKIIYISNLMTRYTQTHGLTASDHLKIIESVTHRPVDYVVVNNQKIPKDIVDLYSEQHEYPVVDDLGENTQRIIRSNSIRPVKVDNHKNDDTVRSYLRHDPKKLADIIMKISQK